MVTLGAAGAGRWGKNWVRTLSGLAKVELRYCCDLDERALDRIEEQHPRITTTTDFRDLVADEELDAVVIATCAPTHFELASRALAASKDVLIEKPMTLTTAEAQELVELAKANECILMVGHLLEYHPAIAYIKRMIDAGDLGEVYYLYSQRLNLGTIRSDENAWWSLAPHDISVACRLFAERPVSIQCRGQNVVQRSIADVAFATLEFDGGKIAHIHVSWLDPHKTRVLTVVGSKKMVVFDDTAPGYKLMIYDKGFEPGQEGFETFTDCTIRHGDIVMPLLDGTEPLRLEAQHFVDCVRDRRPPLSDGNSGVKVVSILEHGQRSLDRDGEVVRIPARTTGAARRRIAA